MSYQMICSKKYRDLGAFPIDPNDMASIKEKARSDAINFYLRIWNDAEFIRTLVILDNLSNLKSLWSAYKSTIKGASAINKTELSFISNVYGAFVDQDGTIPAKWARDSLKLLALTKMPEIVKLKTTPKDNIIGVILEFDNFVFTEYCFTRFDANNLDVTRTDN